MNVVQGIKKRHANADKLIVGIARLIEHHNRNLYSVTIGMVAFFFVKFHHIFKEKSDFFSKNLILDICDKPTLTSGLFCMYVSRFVTSSNCNDRTNLVEKINRDFLHFLIYGYVAKNQLSVKFSNSLCYTRCSDST